MAATKHRKRIVIKIGSSSLAHPETGRVNYAKIERLVRTLCDLQNMDLDVCLVSSGAIAVGRQALGMKERPTDISTKQACAAVGQGKLMMTYQKLFGEYNHTAGQVLLTKNTMVNPVSRENAKNTFEELFKLGVVPIVNENDSYKLKKVTKVDNFEYTLNYSNLDEETTATNKDIISKVVYNNATFSNLFGFFTNIITVIILFVIVVMIPNFTYKRYS